MAVGGPCVIFAPIVFLLMVLALPFWPIAIVILGLLWCVVWVLERIAGLLGIRGLDRWSNHVAYWFIVTLKPRYFFDPVNVRAARRAKYGIGPLDAPAATPVVIRRARAEDAPALAEFAARTFSEAFGADNNPDDLKRHLADSYNPAQQAREIANPDYVNLLAFENSTLAAYAQVRRHAPPPVVDGPDPIELQRFYVDQRWHGRGVARQLMRAVHSAAAELGGRTLWLSTWDRNARGRAFYAKAGFRDVGSADFWVGKDRQTDRILSIPVDAGASRAT